MGQLKKLLQDAIDNGYLYNIDQGMPEFRQPVSEKKAVRLHRNRNDNRHKVWEEDMPDLQGEALADAERAFMSEQGEGIPHWFQLELDLWEGKHGVYARSEWDLEEGGDRE